METYHEFHKSNRNISVLVALIIAVLLFAFCAGANAQTVYTVAQSLSGTYLTGEEFTKVTEPETFTVVLNANKQYQIGFTGQSVTFEYDGVSFSGDFNTIDINTTKTTTISITIIPTEKKGSCAIAVAYLGKNE